MILGYKIRVWTDHTAIQNSFKHKNLRGRWFVTLQKYVIEFEYKQGKKNTAADALSRSIVSYGEVNTVVCSIQELTTSDSELVYSEQRKDDTWKQIIEHLEGKTQSEAQKLPKKYKLSEFQLHNGLLYRNTDITCKGVSLGKVKQLVIPKELVPSVLY